MLIGKVRKLVHLSQQAQLRNAGLASGHNEHGYGVIQDAEGQEVYFPYEAVTGGYGFDDLRQGQQVWYTLEAAPYLKNDERATLWAQQFRGVLDDLLMTDEKARFGNAPSPMVGFNAP